MKTTDKGAARELPPEIEDGMGLERMTNLARRLVSVPREKIEERERAYQDARRTAN